MGLLTELTYIHLEVTSAIDEIERSIAQARSQRHEEETVRQRLSGLRPWVKGLRSVLVDYFDHQRSELFPRVQRVFGADFEELNGLSGFHGLILEALDEFAEELFGLIGGEDEGIHPMGIAYLELLFDDFRELYESHCAQERKFYETYSTIIFPGGAIAD